MNLSSIITSIKTSLRLYDVTLPFKDPDTGLTKPSEVVLQEIIQNVTVPVFSNYQPWIRSAVVTSKSLKCINKQLGIYMLPPELCNTKIMWVSDVRPYTDFGNNGMYYGGGNLYLNANYVSQGQMTSMLVGQMRPEPTFEDLHDYKVALHNFASEHILFEVASYHLPNLESIDEGCYTSFLQLATYDVKVFLYNTLKAYNQLPTAFGTITIDLENYQSAESDRAAMLKEWDDTYHLDMVDWIKFM